MQALVLVARSKRERLCFSASVCCLMGWSVHCVKVRVTWPTRLVCCLAWHAACMTRGFRSQSASALGWHAAVPPGL